MRTKQTLKRLRSVRRHRLALALVSAMAAPAAMAQTAGCQDCLPYYGSVVSGSATSNYSSGGVIRPGSGATPTTMTITQTTRGAIIDWGTFNIASGYAVQITTPDASGVTLNRVVGFMGPGYGVSSSLIDGGLSSNGSVFLVNPAGITFGNGAAVNVGGLVASTLWMNSGDFLNGLSTGQYVFSGFNGDPAANHIVRNDGSITSGAGGVALVGPSVYNGGDITVNGGGTAGLAAGTSVTLDFVGDGLTQVTVTAPPTVDSAIVQDAFGSITADGGRILLRTAASAGGTGGAIYAAGTLRAQSIANVNGRVELTSAGGPVMLGAPGLFSDSRSPFTPGSIDVTGDAGERGGAVLIQGNGVSLVNNDDTPLAPTDPLSAGSSINASGGIGGGQVTLQSTGDVTLLPLSRITADGVNGSGGQVQVAAVGDVLQWGEISASSKTGNGGTVALGSTSGDVGIFGNVTASGGGAGNGGSVSLIAANGVLGIDGTVSADGGANGGQVLGAAGTILHTADALVSANGGTGSGGTIGLAARDAFAAYGRLSARGTTAGGSITTSTGNTFDVRGLRVDAGASAGLAGTWTFVAPNINVIDGNAVGGRLQLGQDLQDAEINTALANGTNVTLRAGTVPTDAGGINFSAGVGIVHDGAMALQFRADANGAISGTGFGIVGNGGPLSMAFNSNAGGTNAGFAGIAFDNATLASNGGDIAFYGQSDLAAGSASSYDRGVSLVGSDISSAGGDVLIRGASTGADATAIDAGVVVEGTSIDAGAGGIRIEGTGAGATSGVILAASTLSAGAGGVVVDGRSTNAAGIDARGSNVVTDGGDLAFAGAGGTIGVAFDGGLYSNGGNIDVRGQGGSGAGIQGAGPVDSGGGDITMVGQSASAIGLDFGGGANSGMLSSGGAISLTGTGVTGGVALRESAAPIVLFAPGDVDRINSGGGALTVTGTASGAGATGVLVDGVSLLGGSGTVTVNGSAPLGVGVLFTNGASASSTTGAITLIGEGADFGLDIADGAIDTVSGDLTLVGTALAPTATAGVRVTGSGLATAGGDISITGTSAGGVGVQLGGRGPFSLTSGGGDIRVTGTGIDAGVSLLGVTANSGGGAIGVTGTASGTGAEGVLLDATRLLSGAGAITVDGSAPQGVGVLFANGSGASSTTGAITLIGEGADFGLDLAGGAIDTVSGDLTLVGTALSPTATAGVRVTGSGLTTAGGDISITGTSAGGVGVQLGGRGPFALSSGGGDIRVTGTGIDAGVSLLGVTANSAGGAIDVTGTASGAGAEGVLLDGTQLIGGAGAVTVDGTAPQGTGVLFANGAGVQTTSGAITLRGTGANVGLDVGTGAIATGSGDLTLIGNALAATATAGVRVTSGGLTTAGGDITIDGSSAGGVGVQIGGTGRFALSSGGGDIRVTGTGIDAGVRMTDTDANSAGGNLAITGVATGGSASTGVWLDGSRLAAGAGNVTVQGNAALGTGVRFTNGSGVTTTSGAISLTGTGANLGLAIGGGTIGTQGGDLTLLGNALASTATAGVLVTGGGLTTNGGDIRIDGTSAGGVGVQLGDGGAFAIGSGGGSIAIAGRGVTGGVSMRGNTVTSSGGDIDVVGDASAAGGIGVDLTNARLLGASGDVTVTGRAAGGTGVSLAGQAGIATTSGDIRVTGIGADVGLALAGGELTTATGHVDLRGRGTAATSTGLQIGQGVRVATAGGGIDLSGEGVGGAGVNIASGAGIDAGNSLIVIRAANNGSSDAIRIGGTIASGLGVDFRPGGVDANGGLTERVDDLIQVGGGTTGFSLTGAELALVSTPQLVIGSNLHRGAIQVVGGVTRNGNLTLQNDGGTGGIAITAGLNVGDNVLALSSGGSITQTSAGAITARSLLARAGGDVLLATAANNVSANTLAGSAGGRFEYQDVDALAIGNVTATGFDATANGLSNLNASGISAGGDVFVRNLAGNLTLGANVRGADIDLVTAGTLQNIAGASLIASGEWRVWANTWVGETRGGLAGSGPLPNLYGCAYQGACGVTVPATDNHFIYVQQPTALITFGNATREYGLPNPLLTFSVSGGILGDTGANVASGTATTTATIGSNVGNYPITGNFTSLAGYRIQLVPGNLAVTPATLLFTADNFVRYLGTANPLFTGTVTGFRNGDTVQSVFGNGVIWNSPAGLLSPIGFYPVNGGTAATNYVFAQAPGNATALQVIPLPQLSSTPIDLIRETVNTYVYDRNFGGAPVCAVNASLEDQQLVSTGDELSNEWSKVRSRPNLTNCFDTERRNSCGDF